MIAETVVTFSADVELIFCVPLITSSCSIESSTVVVGTRTVVVRINRFLNSELRIVVLGMTTVESSCSSELFEIVVVVGADVVVARNRLLNRFPRETLRAVVVVPFTESSRSSESLEIVVVVGTVVVDRLRPLNLFPVLKFRAVVVVVAVVVSISSSEFAVEVEVLLVVVTRKRLNRFPGTKMRDVVVVGDVV